MATIISGSIIQSRFIGTPIIVPIQAASPTGDVTFHRVRLKVKVGDSAGIITGDADFESSQPAGSGEVVQIDISSAFRAFVNRYISSPTVFNYPSLMAEVQACDDYMLNGISHEGVAPSEKVTISGKYVGALSDRERGAGVSNTWSEPARYSRKPTSSPEIAFTGKTLIRPGATGLNAPAVATPTIAAGLNAPYNCYGITAPRDGYEIRFINSLGVHENIFVSRLSAKDVNINTEEYVIAKPETITSFSRGIATKQDDKETWHFSSGALDEAWASWYIHEFLMAKLVWIGINDMWIPCHVLPEETTQLINRAEAKPIEVQFSLKMDINGSPM